MDTKTIVIGIILTLIIGTGIGYTISPNETLNLEEYQKNLTLLQNNNLELQTVLASTESENTELRETLRTAEELFESFEAKLDMFESGFGSPVFDSGWISIDPGETKSMEHGLGTEEDLFVYLIGRYREGQTNQLYYGLGYLWDVEIGNGWSMDDTLISVTRGEADTHWSEIRVYVWKILQGQADQTASTEAEMKYQSDIELIHSQFYKDVISTKIVLDDISKYKYLYVFYGEQTGPDDDKIECKIYYILEDGFFQILAGTLDGQVIGEDPVRIEVACPVIEIWIDYYGSNVFEDQVYVAVYGSPN